jgi:hypothetical protein
VYTLVILLSLPEQFLAVEFSNKFKADFKQFAEVVVTLKVLQARNKKYLSPQRHVAE